MSKKILGIEIGSDSLKIAACSGGVITDMAYYRLKNGAVLDGRITSPSDMAELIKTALKENGIKGSNCALVLPPQSVIGRSVSMPVMNEDELMLNLPFELKDFIGRESDKYFYDYAVKSVRDNVMELYACAVRKADVDIYYDLFRKAGLTLKTAIPTELAWLNLIRGSKNEPGSICIVDIGCSCTSVNIYSGGGFAMGKQIELAGHNIDEALGRSRGIDVFAARTRKEADMDGCLSSACCVDVYSDIATEITRTLKFYNDTHADSKVRDIYYCGGSALIEPLRTAIVKSTDTTPHHISRLVPGSDGKDEITVCCAIAAGAAIQD